MWGNRPSHTAERAMWPYLLTFKMYITFEPPVCFPADREICTTKLLQRYSLSMGFGKTKKLFFFLTRKRMSKHKGTIEYCRHADTSIVYHQMSRIHLSKNKWYNICLHSLWFHSCGQMYRKKFRRTYTKLAIVVVLENVPCGRDKWSMEVSASSKQITSSFWNTDSEPRLWCMYGGLSLHFYSHC